jgi:hypothetical protein
MSTIEIPVKLPLPEVRLLAEIADSKRCTVAEMIEEAVALFVASERRSSSGATE